MLLHFDHRFRKDANPIIGLIQTSVATDTKELHCPHQLTVRVHKATVDLPGDASVSVNQDCSEIIRNKCLDQGICSVSIADCKTTHAGLKQLTIQYSCELATNPQSLFDGKLFFEGVSQQFLVVPGPNGSDQPRKDDRILQRSLRRCLDSDRCQYVTCHDAKLHSEGFNVVGNDRCALVKPNTFKLAGYAVYPNFTGLCGRPKHLESRDFHEVAKAAKSLARASFTIAYKSTGQLGLHRSQSAWVCSGVPTIVPMLGHVVAIPASRDSGRRDLPHTTTKYAIHQ
ncbi:uncharacterized protein BXIN_2576 [Babesia sp. Xinjiang]|uniref:uncharacterized protein n=1 Tax=Babesia sp. Xinjiang TaxID=462227 RepID=UPI000A24A49E|nr:uncharacterized protein BXIN_2576 [Babesia sp. Xinjiang]ORM41414.1 hypothetical protein BXIN_2576 [Babesia sp. Xinjiang]